MKVTIKENPGSLQNTTPETGFLLVKSKDPSPGDGKNPSKALVVRGIRSVTTKNFYSKNIQF